MMVKNAENPVHDFVHEFMTNSCYCVVFYNISNFALLLIEWCFGIVWYCVKSYVLEPLSPQGVRLNKLNNNEFSLFYFSDKPKSKPIIGVIKCN